MTDWQELEHKYYMYCARRLPLTLVRGEGARVWDDQGQEYLDFIAGWAVDCLGHCHAAIVDAVSQQARTLIHVSNQFYSVPQIQLAELLVAHSCLDKVFFANSGAEANEGAVKLARKYGKLHLGGAYEVITTWNSFHGRTLAMVAATGKANYQEPYLPLPSGFVNVDYNDLSAIKQAYNKNTCAVMLEVVQGEGGVNIPHPDYLPAVQAFCRENKLLLILDEVQTGIGRLGTLFGYEQFGIEPDVMTLAKGLGGGVPIGAILVKDQFNVFTPGDHGSTFGGNPLATAAGYATVKYVIEHDVPGNAQRVGAYMLQQLRRLQNKYDFITDVRGRGLLIALEFNADLSGEVVVACMKNGLLVNPVKPNALRFMSPLIITEKEADEAVGVLDQVLAGVKKPTPTTA